MKFKKLFFITVVILFVLSFSACGSDSSTENNSDSQNPNVSFYNLSNNAEVAGITSVEIKATDNKTINEVKLFVDGNEIGSKRRETFSFNVNFSSYEEGDHSLTAKAWDTAGNSASTSINVRVNESVEDNIPPEICFKNISNNQEISGNIEILVDASDNNGIEEVKYYLDDSLIGTSEENPFSYNFNSNIYDSGTHLLKAKAYDLAGNTDEAVRNVKLIYDFAPNENGQLKIKLSDYEELDELDIYGYGDPYFCIWVETSTGDFYHETPVFENKYSVSSICDINFDIDDSTQDLTLRLKVYDKDVQSDDLLDYTEESGYSNYWDIDIEDLIEESINQVYNGENDNQNDDKDCKIRLEAKIITQ